MKRPSVLAFGEVLFDVVDGVEHIGGAPFNFAAHASLCGLDTSLYSAVGKDARGGRVFEELERFQVRRDWVCPLPSRPTGWVDVVLHNGQPTYTIVEGVAWDQIPIPTAAESEILRAAQYDAIYVGTLAQRSAVSRAALHAVRETLRGVNVFYDVNLREPFTTMELVVETLQGSAIVKFNEEEAALLMHHLWKKQFAPGAFYARLAATFGIHILLITRGSEGCYLVSREGFCEIAGENVQVASAVGAGDAFSAAFLSGHLMGLPADKAAQRANKLGAWVASRPETVPDHNFA
jgi:fructokinase